MPDWMHETRVKESEIGLPNDIQYVYNEPITLLPSKAINTITWDTSASYINLIEYSKVAINVKVDQSKPFKIDLYWSEDGISISAVQNLLDKTAQWDSVVVEVRAQWMKVAVYNGDTATRTFEIKGLKKVL